MMIDKKSIEYQLNKVALREMEEVVPMTLSERTAIRNWVRCGHEVESNPWGYYDADGCPMNYLQAYRIKFGYLSGPWDYWHGSGDSGFWSDNRRSLIPLDEL